VFYNDAPSFNRFTAMLEAGVWHFRRNVAVLVAGGWGCRLDGKLQRFSIRSAAGCPKILIQIVRVRCTGFLRFSDLASIKRMCGI
jgi:hypothetical protein